MDNVKKLVAAGALVGFLGVGGMSLASAQDDPTTSTTTPSASEDTTPQTGDDGHCPHAGSDSSSTGDTTTPD